MTLYKTKAIILRTRKFGEADRIITLFSPNCGKIKAIAKGIRKTKSKFGARLEPFSYVNLLLYKGKNLDIITQVETIDSFQKIREDLKKLSAGSVVLDLLEKVSLESESNYPLFELSLSFFEKISSSIEGLEFLLMGFEIKSLALLGYQPILTHCSFCQINLNKDKKWFSFSRGGVLCDNCAKDIDDAILLTISDFLLKLLNSNWEEISQFKAKREIVIELLKFLEDYFYYYLQLKLKSKAWWNQVLKII